MKFSLQKRIKQARDFIFHKSFKLGAVSLPDELNLVSPILNQGSQDCCTAYAAVSVRWNETNQMNFDPQEFWQEELQFAGLTENNNGFDIQVPAAVAVKSGFQQIGQTGTFLTNRPSAYFWIIPNNGQDLFDSARSAMLTQNYPLLAGLTWFNDYTFAPGGVISALGTSVDGGHCVKLSGWQSINGEPYMTIQNSWGPTFGDNGLYYMSREVFNTAFSGYGIILWSDSQDVEIKTLGMINALWENILTLLGK